MKTDDERDLDLTQRFARQARDFDDLQHELADRDVGRRRRFLPGDARNAEATEKRRAERVEAATRLQLLLQSDPAYAALYNDTMDLLGRAETATETALEKAQAALKEANQALNDTLDRAVALSDGRKVFRDAEGRVWTEDGDQLSPDAAVEIEWTPGAPGYEAFLARKAAAERARADVDDVRHYQVNVLGEARELLTDQDNPPDKEELEQARRRISEKMPDQVRREIESAPVPTVSALSTAATPKPEI